MNTTVMNTDAFKALWRRIMPAFVVSAFYFGVLVYPILRIWNLISPSPPGTPALLVIMVGPLTARLAYEFAPGSLTRWLSAAALTWLGICLLAFSLVLGWEFIRLLIVLPDQIWGYVLLAATTSLSGYAYLNAQRLQVRSVPVPVPAPKVPVSSSGHDSAAGMATAQGLRLVQISDVHVGSRSGRFLSRVVRRVNEQNPDYVLITGDLIDFSDIQIDEIQALGSLDAPAIFIIGNHERYVDTEEICERLEALGIRVLRNESIIIGGLQIIGIDDAEPKTQVRSEIRRLRPEPDKFRILLYHRPDGAGDAQAWGAHLMLCGHTHNGQILPFNLLVRRIFPKICGRYQIGNMQLYVSPGTGTWGPILRLGSRCEISIIELT